MRTLPFRPRAGTAISETELRRRLRRHFELLGIPYSDASDYGPIVLGETGITIWLTLGENGSPVEAEVDIPVSNVRQVAGIFSAFRSVGWKPPPGTDIENL